ncbi:MAG: DUF3368 domain-containing protein [Gammaproteobacteria bacterium]|nr:DUF3368 domain-containing protein [Gammaproteobacteria bacterium]
MSDFGDPSVTKAEGSSPSDDLPFAADTGPLIALGRVEKLQLLPRLFGAGVIPPAVHREARIESGRPGAKRIGEALSAPWLRVAALADETPVANLLRVVDAGEAEAMALCLQRQARILLIDDAKGRDVARRAGIPLVGVAGVLLAAKSKGLLVAVSPVLEDLVGVGYRLSRQLIDGIRRRANE